MAQHPSRCVSLSEVVVLSSPSPSLVAPPFPSLNPPPRYPSVLTISYVQHLQRHGCKGNWCTSRSKGQTLRNGGGTHLASPTRKKFAGQSVTNLEESKAQEISKLQNSLHEMQGILDETTTLLVTIEATPVIQEKEVIIEDTAKIDALTVKVERLKTNLISSYAHSDILKFITLWHLFKHQRREGGATVYSSHATGAGVYPGPTSAGIFSPVTSPGAKKNGGAAAADGGGKDLHMFVWSSSASPISEGGIHVFRGGDYGNDHLGGVAHQKDYEEFGHDEFSFGNRTVANGVDKERPVLSKLGSSSTAEFHPKNGAQGESKPTNMPPTSVMTRLILIMVWRKLIRNPNTYSSLIGLIWSLISFKSPSKFKETCSLIDLISL
ncbi:hypothetical protein Ahy_B08g090858 isoform A [Arachis hypogaea]|uniref:Uncharacterized protein n=2 Tax=Arachis hypogaea TaxID=3818 RepID=A0A444Y0U0_ARAHY|nr:hypothetical protein Ahy_B08g090858 isoform A [Arachis hypogaea]